MIQSGWKTKDDFLLFMKQFVNYIVITKYINLYYFCWSTTSLVFLLRFLDVGKEYLVVLLSFPPHAPRKLKTVYRFI